MDTHRILRWVFFFERVHVDFFEWMSLVLYEETSYQRQVIRDTHPI